MNTEKKLSIGMAIFFVFVISFFGYIIMMEKGNPLMNLKLEKKLTNYIDNNYQNIIDEVDIGKIHYDHAYYVNVYNKNNHNLFFKVIYKSKRIKSTYQKDYVLGTTLLKNYEQVIKKKIKCKKYSNIKIKFLEDLSTIDTSTRKKLLNSESIEQIPIYEVKLTKNITKNNLDNIKSLINNFYNYSTSKNIKPKYYSFKINNIELNNLTEDIILYRLDDTISDKLILEKEAIK